MNNNLEVTAVIVAKGKSARLANKNLLTINNVSILERKIQQLKNCKNINKIVVGSEDVNILNIAKNAGVIPIKRPDNYCDEKQTSANEMIKNMCELIETDIVVWSHCTNPLISSKTYDKAIKCYFDSVKNGYDSLLSVFELKEHLWDNEYNVFNYNPYQKIHPLASSLNPLYAQDGAIFIQPHAQMKENSYFFGKKPKLFIVPNDEVMDINTPHDFAIAKAYIELKELK